MTTDDLEQFQKLLDGVSASTSQLQNQFAELEGPLYQLHSQLIDAEDRIASLEQRLSILRKS